MRYSNWLFAPFILFALTCSAQVSFKKGYYIDNQGNKTECLIKDVDWKNAPSSFNYKLDEAGSVEKMDTKDVTEFAAGETKYLRAKVKYDQSPQEYNKLSVIMVPDWVEEELLLRVVVEGKATLYAFNRPGLTLYFYKVDNGNIEQLIYKTYLNASDAGQVLKNNGYLNQLNGRVRCGEKLPVTEKQLPYIQRPLEKYFQDFNTCSGDPVKPKSKSEKTFALSITPGVDFTSVTAKRVDVRNYDFGSSAQVRIGAEMQFTLPFNHNKWAIVAEPNYNQFHSTKDGGLDYALIEIPIGVRHRFFLSDNASIFINALGLLDYPIKHEQKFSNGIYTMGGGAYGWAAGAGFSYLRLSVEGRFYPSHERSQAGAFTYQYKKSTIILGFRIF